MSLSPVLYVSLAFIQINISLWLLSHYSDGFA